MPPLRLRAHELPSCVCACFGCDLCFGSDGKRIYVTLGQFSIVRLERDAQLLMPVYDYCMPEKECTCGGCEDDPCEILPPREVPGQRVLPAQQPRAHPGQLPGSQELLRLRQQSPLESSRGDFFNQEKEMSQSRGTITT